MENAVLERVKMLLRNESKSVREFANRINVSYTTLNQQIKGDRGISVDVVNAILNSFENISAEWLLRGDGPMYREEKTDGIPSSLVRTDPAKGIGYVPPCAPTGQVAEPYTAQDTQPDIRPANPGEKGIPLIPVEAMAGALTSEQTVLEYECERYVVPIFNGADFLIPVKGSSMYPKYSSGDIVACKRIPMDRLFFQWNKVYVIDTVQGPLIKRIKRSTDPSSVLIVSDNPNYDPFELPLSDISAVALVIGVIRLE